MYVCIMYVTGGFSCPTDILKCKQYGFEQIYWGFYMGQNVKYGVMPFKTVNGP